LWEHTNNPKFLEAIVNFSESNKSIILLEAVNDLHAKQFSNIPDSLVEKERLIRVDIAYYSKKLFYELEKDEIHQDSAFISQMYDKIYNLTEKKELANSYFHSNYPEYNNLKNGLEIPKTKYIQENLNPDMALIEYFITNESIYIMLFVNGDFILEKVNYSFDIDSTVNSFKNNKR